MSKYKPLTFEILCKKLCNKECGCTIKSKDAVIRSAKLLIKDDLNLDSDIVYIGFVSDFPKDMPCNNILNLVCIVDCSIPDFVLENPLINIIFVRENSTVPAMLNIVSNIFKEYQKYIFSYTSIINTLTENIDLQSVVNLCSDILGNPVSVVDASLKLLAYTKNIDVADHLWNELLTNEYPSYNSMLIFEQDKYFEKLAKENKPFIAEAGQSFNIRRIMGKIIHNKKIAGYIAILEYNKPFQEDDIELAFLICKVIANKIAQEKYINFSNNLMFEDLLIDILDRKIKDPMIISERLSYLGWKNDAKYNVLTLDISMQDKTESMVHYLKNAIQKITEAPNIIVYNKKIVIIIGYNNDGYINSGFLAPMINFMKENKLYAGLSRSFDNISELYKYYKQSVISIEFGLKCDPNSSLYYYDDYSLLHMAQICSKQSELMDFCHSSLLQLIEYDKKNSTDFVNTLQAFVLHNRNLSTSAESIYIHRNTMHYRIKKIKEITAVDLNDEKTISHLIVSFKLLQYASIIGAV